ncbi:hypothetical protein DL95DRAFT_458496 [Leptodontidium sp. 2 PMI_412]|nr:hypothetical protein DL95DRAFT_458496 [Leptodontidium sp. 2 PMI_412]
MDTSENTKVLASRADVQTNLFLNPPETRSSGPDNSEWILGTTQHIRWSTDFSNFDFFLYQQLACGDHSCVNGPFLIAENLTSETKTWDWQVTTGTLTLKPTNTFFLRMIDVNDEKNEFDSSTLDFTSSGPAGGASSSLKLASTSTLKPSSTTTIDSSSSASASPSVSSTSDIPVSSSSSFISASTTVAGSTPTVAFATTPTAQPASSPDGISIGAKIGMIIGAVFLVVIAIFLGWYLGKRRKNKSTKSPFHPFENPAPTPPVQLSELHVLGWGEQKPIPPPFTPRELYRKGKFDNFTGVRELDAWDKPSELGDRRGL